MDSQGKQHLPKMQGGDRLIRRVRSANGVRKRLANQRKGLFTAEIPICTKNCLGSNTFSVPLEKSFAFRVMIASAPLSSAACSKTASSKLAIRLFITPSRSD